MFKILEICVLIICYFKLCQCQDEAWDSFQSTFTNLNREELSISNVTSEKLFHLGYNITKWKTLSIGPTCYSIGLTEKGLHILVTVLNKDKTGFKIENSFYDTETKPSDVTIFHNRNNGKSEAVVAVSFINQTKINWLRISSQNVIQEFWSWTIEQPAIHVNFLRIGIRHLLFFVTNNSVGYLYEFDIKNNALNYWFIHRLPLESTPTSSAFNNFKNQYFLTIPQKDSITIYKYSKTEFKEFKKITTPKITFIVNFNIGFKTFFAVNGLNAGIYQFSENGLIRQKFLNSNLNGVNFWLPIPLETIRDEVFLLTQRVLDHSTHRTFEIDIITYNNDKFEEHEDTPCSVFGESTNGLGCLTYENGILGSTYVVIEDQIGVVVPRLNNSFILFKIHTRIKHNPHPREQEVLDLLKTKKHLENLIEKANKTFEEIVILLDVPENQGKIQHQQNIVGEPQNLSSYLLEVEKIGLEVDKLYNKVENLTTQEKKSKFDTIFINGDAMFDDEFEVKEMNVDNINKEPTTKLLNDIISKEAINKKLKNKTFTELEIDNLNAATANGIDTKNIAFKDETEIILNGSITFNQFAMIENVSITTKKINDIYFESEAVILDKKQEGTLEFEQIKVEENLLASRINNVNLDQVSSVKNSKSKRNLSGDLDDTLFISKNLTVSFINGENFTLFLHSLCMINRKCYIPGKVKIHQKIRADLVDAAFLNDLKFPDEYILLNSQLSGNIIGKKTFKNSLTAEDVRSTTINGVQTKNLVTLSTDQNLEDITFKQLELTEQLDVDGKISGEHVDKFLANPTLQDTNRIKSNVNFKNLVVKGNISIDQNFNDKNLGALLENFVYNDEDAAAITSIKEFPKGVTIDKELQIKSDSINTIDLKNFVTKNTDQNLNINLLNGNTVINNLLVSGSYDGKDIKVLDDSLVKLSGDQFIFSALSFDDLVVRNLEIDRKLNDIKAEEFLYTSGAEMDKDFGFRNLIVENLTIKGNLIGEISGFDLKEINEKYLSLTKNQTIHHLFNINSSKIDNLKSIKSNKELFEESSYLQHLQDLLNSGHLKAKNLYVDDSMDISNINDKPINVILPVTVLELAKANGNKLIFENNLYLKELELTNFSSVNWNDYIKQIVYKNETNTKIIFTGPKNFLNDLTVENLIETNKINNVSIQNILTKEGEQIVRGPVELVGDVSVGNVEVKEEINGMSVKEFLKMFLVSDKGAYHLKRDMVFKRLSYIKSLKIEGSVNNKTIENLLQELVYLNKSIEFKNDVIFTKSVNISGNLAINDHFNNLNFSDINSKMVLITQDADIDSLVSFSKSVEVEQKMTVEEDLSSKFVKGFNTENWLNKAIYVNKGLLEGKYHLDSLEINSKLTTDFINDLNMTRIVPLRTNQSIDYLQFKLLKFLNKIPVDKTVNGLSLPLEMRRTLMKDTDQDIVPTTIFKNILIRQNLKSTLLNNKPTSKIVTTNTKQNLTAKYNFNSKINLDSDLNINGLINKVDWEKWKSSTLKLNSSKPSHISNEWNVLKNFTFEENADGNAKISDLDIPKVAKEIQEKKDLAYKSEQGIVNDHIGLCESITYFYQKTKSQINKFKYFEDFQKLSFNNTIKHVFKFDFKKTQYLLINQENCLSDLMVFNGSKFLPSNMNVNTGLIKQIVPVSNGDALFIVMRGDKTSNCNNIRGTNIWEFDGQDLELKFNMDSQELLQDSQVPSTFYTFGDDGVIEYKIKESEGPVKYRRWNVSFEDDIGFIPRGLKTGLAMRTGDKIIYLDRPNRGAEELILDPRTEAILTGSFREVFNDYIPGRDEGDMVILKVGIKSAKKNLLAVAHHEETVVTGSLDFIKIYENPFKGKLFDKVAAYKPSSLLSIEFGQGETILAFLEDKRSLQIYEYKGIEGFQPRNSIKVDEALLLFQMDLPQIEQQNIAKTIGIVYKNNIRLIQAVMEGTKIRDDWKCNL